MKMNPVWQKRFKKKINLEVLEFTSSVTDDQELVQYDILCSIVHTEMLARMRIISYSDCRKIIKGLYEILADYRDGRFKLLPACEDVHMNIEFQLKEKIGSTAEKLHTARSRNDLIATDLRLFSRYHIAKIARAILEFQRIFLKKSIEYKGIIIPGYTHLQQAQPVLVSFYLGSFFFKFQRDFGQLIRLSKWIDVLPLGSCAFAGTGISIDPVFIKKRLGMNKICENALDGVSDRDFLCDMIYYLTRIQLHLSQLAEDFIIFSTQEFNIVELDDSITTGSSIMPHKKNPDVFELLRARSGTAIGRLTSALTVLKGLPGSYNRDLQELKPILFEQIRETLINLNIATTAVDCIKFQTPGDWVRKPNWMCINDLIDFYVGKEYPFRKIYELVSITIKQADKNIDKFIALFAKKMKVSQDLIRARLTPEFSIKNKISMAGTGYRSVKRQIALMEKIISDNKMVIKNLIKLTRGILCIQLIERSDE